MEDRPRLPFMEALISEIFRTYTTGPMGLPHVATEDDIHRGLLISKGAIIVANNWRVIVCLNAWNNLPRLHLPGCFYRDCDIYADPETFRPERFIETATYVKEKDFKDILFGYGRRACPGKNSTTGNHTLFHREFKSSPR
ncbi:cytochrome P450 [Mycena rosella]|uniref:Cytochrome P450 n=1 Tax=Mycena rosella TaxID=1033263 RepID=A0AAD7GZC4_MYCRO|nr:cytochrome P450 [Mycena rosella]